MAEQHQPPLENGWQPETPRHDTVLRTAILAHADGFEHVAATRGGRILRDSVVSLADAGSASPFFNVATLLRPPLGQDWDEIQERVEAFFGSRPGGGVVLFNPWPASPIERSGWELLGHPPLMVRPMGSLPLPPPPDDLRVDEVADDELLSAFEAVLVEGYPLDEVGQARPGCLFDGRVLEDGRYRCWLGSVGNRAVAAAAVHLGDDMAVVAWVATVPHFRRRGYAAAVTSVALSEARRRPAALISSDPGRPVYERLGFFSLLRITAWLWRDRGTAVNRA